MKTLLLIISYLGIFTTALVAQSSKDTIAFFNNYQEFDSVIVTQDEQYHIDYLQGTINYIFSDSSIITPAGIFVQLYELQNDNSQILIAKTLTTSKGNYYFENLSTGKYALEVLERSKKVCKKYFYVNDSINYSLSPLTIPIEKVEEIVKKDSF